MSGKLNRLWAFLVIGALGSSCPAFSAVAAPVREAAVERPAVASPACALRAAPAPVALGDGIVVSLIERTEAQALIGRTQAQAGGEIDPAYVDNQRLAVTLDDGRRLTVLAPAGIVVHVGDRVAVQSSYRNAQLPCNYVPNLVTADLGPAPTPIASTGSGAQACALQASPVPNPLGSGTVASFIDRARAQALIGLSEVQAGGKIDPAYVDNLRVAVSMDGGGRATVLVPDAMVVHVGDRVAVQSSFRSARLPCNYVPNLVTADLGPAP